MLMTCAFEIAACDHYVTRDVLTVVVFLTLGVFQVVTLHDKAPYFEDFGLRMTLDVCDHSGEEEQTAEAREAYVTIQNAMVNRSRHLLDLSENSSNEDTSTLLKGLTEREKELFALGQASSQSFRFWKERSAATIKKAQVGKKRFRGS